jgi:molybdopterin adenylyltransferase
VSDRCARGEREDLSGPAVADLLREYGFSVDGHLTVADEQEAIEDALRCAAGVHRLIVTTGGTGLTVRDVTPEATCAVCTRLLDGLAEQMRAEGLKETPFAVLSRGVCGVLGNALIVNVPGAPRGAVTSLCAVLPVLSHALQLLADPAAPHPEGVPPPEKLAL